MSGINEYADNLQRDVISEMAEHYFGTRKNLDDMMEVIARWTDELRGIEEDVELAAGRLHSLLLRPEIIRAFYAEIAILPACAPPVYSQIPSPLMEQYPFAVTQRGRWIKCVVSAYDELAKAVDEYLNGRHFLDDDGRRKLTIHYVRLKAMVEYVNAEVARINREMAPSETLRYIRNMDPDQAAKEELISGCPEPEGCSLDSDLRFDPIDFDELGLLQVQNFPEKGTVEKNIVLFCQRIYPDEKHTISILLHKD